MTDFEIKEAEGILREIALMDLGSITINNIQTNWSHFQDIQRRVVDYFKYPTRKSFYSEPVMADE